MATTSDDRFIRDDRALAEWLPLLISDDRITRREAENAISAMYWGAPVADASALENAAPNLNAHHAALADAVVAAILDPASEGQRFLSDLVAMMHVDVARESKLQALESRLDDLTFNLLEEESAEDGLDDEQEIDATPPDQRGPPPDLTDVPALQAQIRRLQAEEIEGKLVNSFGPDTVRVVLELAGGALVRWPDLARELAADDEAAPTVMKAIARVGPRGAALAADLSQQRPAAST